MIQFGSQGTDEPSVQYLPVSHVWVFVVYSSDVFSQMAFFLKANIQRRVICCNSCVCDSILAEIRNKLSGVSFSLPCGSLVLNSSCQAWWQGKGLHLWCHLPQEPLKLFIFLSSFAVLG